MSIWQITALLVAAGCATGCTIAIFRAIGNLAKGVLSVGAELKKINAKLESVEAVNRDDSGNRQHPAEDPDLSLEAIEAAISNFEKLKRVDLTEP